MSNSTSSARKSARSTSWRPARCRRAFPSIEIEGEHYWDGGIASNTPLDYVLDEETSNDLLIFQVDLFSARGPLPHSLLEAAEREKDIRFSSRTRMNTDKNRQLHNARKAVRDLIDKLPDDLKNDPSVELLREAAKENTVTVVHLIYKQQELRDPLPRITTFPMLPWSSIGRRASATFICRCVTRNGWSGRNPAKPW